MRVKSFLLSLAVLLFFSLTNVSNAQSNLDLLPPDLQGEINKDLTNAVNALVIFSSSSSLGSGTFGFRDDEGPDPELDVFKLMGQYDFGDPESDPTVPYIKAGIGKTKLKEVIPDFLEMGGRSDFSTIDTWSFLIGTGIDLQLIENLHLVPYFDLVYSYSENEYDFNNEFSQTILALFDQDIVNWDVHTMGYNPGAKLYYRAEFGRGAFIPSVNYTQVFLEDLSTNSELLDLSTSSGVLQSKLIFELPVTEGSDKGGVFAIPSFSRTDIYGDARDSGLDYYHEVGLAFVAREQTMIPLLSEVGISAGYAFADDMWGWRVGLEGGF